MLLPPPTIAPPEGARGPPRGQWGEKAQGRADIGRKEGRWGGTGAGRKPGPTRSEGRHPGTRRSGGAGAGGGSRAWGGAGAASPRSQRFAPRSETRGNRLLIAEVGGKGSGSQPGSEWQRGKRRPPPPPPPLLLSRGRAGCGQPPHPTPVAGRRRGGRGSPERMQQAGGPAEGSAAAARSPAGSGGPPGPRRGHFAATLPPHPPTLPLPARVIGVKSCRRC